jgi:acyl-CoA synthetase (AMP-forming)/AMP-acid ligase II
MMAADRTGGIHTMTEHVAHDGTFWSLIARRAEATPNAVFLEDETGVRLTFAQYRDRAEAVAAGLLAEGVAPGSVLTWQLPTTVDTAVLMAALGRLGVLQNPVIPILRSAEVRSIAGSVGTQTFLTLPEWRGFDHGGLARDLSDEFGLRALVLEHLPVGDPATLPAPPAADGAIRWILSTSGSTAAPKNAKHTDPSAMAGMNAFVHYIRPEPDDVLPIAFPIAHIGGISMMSAALTVGFRMLLLHTFDPAESPRLMAARGATILGSALPFFVAYLGAQKAHGPERLFPRLRVCVNGGAPKPATLHEELKRELGGIGVVGSWGLTEFPVATSGGLDDGDEDLAATEGRAAPGVEIRVVSLEGAECGPGEEGELRLKGPQMFAGYTHESMNADAWDDQGWFRTGDLGVVSPTGHVTITGRVKDIIIRNAENISAAEVENTLHAMDEVADAVVIGVPDPKTGERVCAVVVPAPGRTVTLAGIAAFCQERGLARQKTPERLEIVDAIPRNSMGKPEKPSLRKRFAQP